MDKEYVISLDTIKFLRGVCSFVKLSVSDESFRTDATNMIKALDELDAAIAEAQSG